jgi:predicted ATPase
MITKLKLVNYRSHKDTTVDLDPLTVFIGPCGGGKSNLFKGLGLLSRAMAHSPKELFAPGPRGFASERYAGVESATASIGLGVEGSGTPGFEGDDARYTVEFAPGPEGAFIAREELDRLSSAGADTCVFERDQTRSRAEQLAEFGTFHQDDPAVLMVARLMEEGQVEELPGSQPMGLPNRRSPGVRFAAAVSDFLVAYGSWHLQPAGLKRYSRALDSGRRLGYEGSGLPAVLKGIRSDPELSHGFQAIVEEMREFFPDLRELQLPSVSEDRLGLGFAFAQWQTALSNDDVSDGMLLALGIITLLHQPQMPRVMALEEPETGLHPSLLRWLVDKLWDAAHGHTGRPPVQVLVSTHSPYFLDHFAETPEVVRVVDQVDGVSRVRSLPQVYDSLGWGPERIRGQPLGEHWYSGVFEGAPR